MAWAVSPVGGSGAVSRIVAPTTSPVRCHASTSAATATTSSPASTITPRDRTGRCWIPPSSTGRPGSGTPARAAAERGTPGWGTAPADSPTTWNVRCTGCPRMNGLRGRTRQVGRRRAADRHRYLLGLQPEAELLVLVGDREPQVGRRVAPVLVGDRVPTGPPAARGHRGDRRLQVEHPPDLEVALLDDGPLGIEGRDRPDAEGQRLLGGVGVLRRLEQDDRRLLLARVDGQFRRVHLPPRRVEADDVHVEGLDEVTGVLHRHRELRLPAGLGPQPPHVHRQDGLLHGGTLLPRRRTAQGRVARCPNGRPALPNGRPPPRARAPGPLRCSPDRQEGAAGDPRGRRGAAGADPGRGARGTEVEVVLRRADQGLGGAAQRADGRRLPLRHPRGPAPPRARAGSTSTTARDGSRARHLPPRHFKLSYLVTAWTQRPEDEHRLLSALLACFLRHDAMPARRCSTGPLAELGPAGAADGRPAAARGPRVRRRVVRARRRAEAVAGRRGQRADRHRPAPRARPRRRAADCVTVMAVRTTWPTGDEARAAPPSRRAAQPATRTHDAASRPR